jgi:hypothetical protein
LFRQAIQTRTPEWALVWDRPNPRYADGPRDCWYVHRAALASMEGWSIVWVWSTVLTLRQHARRVRNLAAAEEQLQQLRQRLASAKTRLRGAAEIDLQVKLILEKYHVARYLKVRRVVREENEFKQTHRGRPGPTPPTARSPSGALTCSGAPTSRPSPTTARATACTP